MVRGILTVCRAYRISMIVSMKKLTLWIAALALSSRWVMASSRFETKPGEQVGQKQSDRKNKQGKNYFLYCYGLVINDIEFKIELFTQLTNATPFTRSVNRMLFRFSWISSAESVLHLFNDTAVLRDIQYCWQIISSMPSAGKAYGYGFRRQDVFFSDQRSRPVISSICGCRLFCALLTRELSRSMFFSDDSSSFRHSASWSGV